MEYAAVASRGDEPSAMEVGSPIESHRLVSGPLESHRLDWGPQSVHAATAEVEIAEEEALESEVEMDAVEGETEPTTVVKEVVTVEAAAAAEPSQGEGFAHTPLPALLEAEGELPAEPEGAIPAAMEEDTGCVSIPENTGFVYIPEIASEAEELLGDDGGMDSSIHLAEGVAEAAATTASPTATAAGNAQGDEVPSIPADSVPDSPHCSEYQLEDIPQTSIGGHPLDEGTALGPAARFRSRSRSVTPEPASSKDGTRPLSPARSSLAPSAEETHPGQLTICTRGADSNTVDAAPDTPGSCGRVVSPTSARDGEERCESVPDDREGGGAQSPHDDRKSRRRELAEVAAIAAADPPVGSTVQV